MGGLTLNQVTVPCTDYAASVAFYKLLGLIQIVDAPPRYARFECPVSEGGGAPATFSIHQVDDWTGADDPIVYFETDALDDLVTRLGENGVTILTAPEDKTYLWREADVRDPAGNLIRLYTAGENRRFPPWRMDT